MPGEHWVSLLRATQPVLIAKYSFLLYCLLVVLMICFLARRVSVHVFLPGGVACYYHGGRNWSWICSSVLTIRQSPFWIVGGESNCNLCI